ncbi:hypothetical protein EXIGLDRAFT_776332 [Exidia glandulosa HHB12029]|uniref:F-box domain-containing protein n=1 Tax=Exidia glandulosa HHB12029 TaxID=1314781 RepID=A0A165DJ18_EXIGL|nr:hypothetical protein EXIGLDRAFT_776332 [Exidia glandulosa HHB12029]
MPDYTERVPLELLPHIFNYLPQPADLFAAAAVCARWRTPAKQHDNCYRSASMDTSDWWSVGEASGRKKFKRFRDDIQTACETGTYLHVTLTLVYHAWANRRELLDLTQKIFDVTGTVTCVALIRRISTEMPVLYSAAFFAAVCEVPAPALQHFHIRVYGDPPLELIPSDLFCGQAPCLTSVSWQGIAALPEQPVLAFARVETVACRPDDVGMKDLYGGITRQFPRLRRLACYIPDDPRRPSWKFADGSGDFDALAARLHSLSITMKSLATLHPDWVEGDISSLWSACAPIPSIRLHWVGRPPASIRGAFDLEPVVLALHHKLAPSHLSHERTATFEPSSWVQEINNHDYEHGDVNSEADSPRLLHAQFTLASSRSRRARTILVDGPHLEWCLSEVSGAAVTSNITFVRIWHAFIRYSPPCVAFLAALPALSRLHLDICDHSSGGYGEVPDADRTQHRTSLWPSLDVLCIGACANQRDSVRPEYLLELCTVLRLAEEAPGKSRPALDISDRVVYDVEPMERLLRAFFSELRHTAGPCALECL